EGEGREGLGGGGGGLRRSGVAQTAMTAALKAENVATCNPPLGDAEVEKIAASVARYPLPAPAKGEDPAEYVMQALLKDSFDGGKHLMFCQDGQFWQFDGRKWSAAHRMWIEGGVLRTIRRM